jgi:hypothetical protein
MNIFEKKQLVINKYEENRTLNYLKNEYYIYNPINDGSCCYRAFIQCLYNLYIKNPDHFKLFNNTNPDLFDEKNELIRLFDNYIRIDNHNIISDATIDGFCYTMNINDENEIVLLLHEMIKKYVEVNSKKPVLEMGYDTLEKFILDVHNHSSLNEYYRTYEKTFIDNFYTCNHWGGTPELYILSKIFNINIFTYLLQKDYVGFLISTRYDGEDLSLIKLNLSELFLEDSQLDELDRPIVRLCLENYDNSEAHYLGMIEYNVFY